MRVRCNLGLGLGLPPLCRYPFVVAVYKPSGTYQCVGTLVHPRYMLTRAHFSLGRGQVRCLRFRPGLPPTGGVVAGPYPSPLRSYCSACWALLLTPARHTPSTPSNILHPALYCIVVCRVVVTAAHCMMPEM